jgi:hypothetical protein
MDKRMDWGEQRWVSRSQISLLGHVAHNSQRHEDIRISIPRSLWSELPQPSLPSSDLSTSSAVRLDVDLSIEQLTASTLAALSPDYQRNADMICHHLRTYCRAKDIYASQIMNETVWQIKQVAKREGWSYRPTSPPLQIPGQSTDSLGSTCDVTGPVSTSIDKITLNPEHASETRSMDQVGNPLGGSVSRSGVHSDVPSNTKVNSQSAADDDNNASCSEIEPADTSYVDWEAQRNEIETDTNQPLTSTTGVEEYDHQSDDANDYSRQSVTSKDCEHRSIAHRRSSVERARRQSDDLQIDEPSWASPSPYLDDIALRTPTGPRFVQDDPDDPSQDSIIVSPTAHVSRRHEVQMSSGQLDVPGAPRRQPPRELDIEVRDPTCAS